jgi:ribonuclease Z
MSSLRLQILGCSSATPTKDRFPTAQVLTVGSRKILIDCGEGTQVQMLHYGINAHKIDTILISHLHGDHYFGLIGLLCTMSLMGRKNEVVLIGPPPLKQIIDIQLENTGNHLEYNLKFIPNKTNSFKEIYSTETYKISSFPLKHRITCNGFMIEEVYSKLPLNYAKCKELGIPKEYFDRIKSGADYIPVEGETIPNSELVYPRKKQSKYAYVSDTLFDPELAKSLPSPDLLYHEATFLHELEERAKSTFHSTAKQAGQFASMCNAQQLLIGHYSARYKETVSLLNEAQGEFANTIAAHEGLEIAVL